jgi:hypothetical protein
MLLLTIKGQQNHIMNLSILKYFFFAVCIFSASMSLEAQGQLSSFIDVGENNVSEGYYVKSSLVGNYQFGKTNISAGAQLNLKNAAESVFSGTYFKVSREIKIKTFPFDVEGLFLYTPFSKLIHESNLGLVAIVDRTHFTWKLGTNFRTYRIRNEAAETYDIESNRSLHENWNIMYLFGYRLKPIDNKWNVGISLTNIDYFLINQETNPMVYLKGSFEIKPKLKLYTEYWYKSAGSLNISANSFGAFIRAGIIWKIDSKK